MSQPARHPVTRFQRAYPMATAWITAQTLYTLAYIVAIMAPNAIFRFVTGGHFEGWANHHSSLVVGIVVFATLTLCLKLAELLSPAVNQPNTWPVADQLVRVRLQTFLGRIRWFHYLGVIVLFLVAAFALDHFHLSVDLAYPLLFAWMLTLHLRQHARAHQPVPPASSVLAQS